VLGVHARSVAIGWFVVVISIGSLEAGQTVRGPYEATINRALGLAQAASQGPRRRCHPGRPGGGRSRASSRGVRPPWGERRVLDLPGRALRGAQKGRGIFDYALAILIWDEMAHLAGADEREAQRKQEDP
jgi:hypothetical protein